MKLKNKSVVVPYGMPSFDKVKVVDGVKEAVESEEDIKRREECAALAREKELIKIRKLELEELEKTVKANAVTIEQEAKDRGFAQGYEEASQRSRLEIEEKAAPLFDEFAQIIEELKALRHTMLAGVEPQLSRLAFEIAKKVIVEDMESNTERIVSIVKAAISRIEKLGPITIKVNPLLYELFNKKKDEFLVNYPDIIFDIDPSTPPEGAVVISAEEIIATDYRELLRNISEDTGIGQYEDA